MEKFDIGATFIVAAAPLVGRLESTRMLGGSAIGAFCEKNRYSRGEEWNSLIFDQRLSAAERGSDKAANMGNSQRRRPSKRAQLKMVPRALFVKKIVTQDVRRGKV